jgi:hypothetical protein
MPTTLAGQSLLEASVGCCMLNAVSSLTCFLVVVLSLHRDGICFPCPTDCQCSGNRIQGCWPVVSLGWISGAQIADGNVHVQAVTPFSIEQILPCSSTVSGESLCNGDFIMWTSFYALRRVGVSKVVSEDAPEGFCFPGHTGRLCAECSSGQRENELNAMRKLRCLCLPPLRYHLR